MAQYAFGININAWAKVECLNKGGPDPYQVAIPLFVSVTGHYFCLQVRQKIIAVLHSTPNTLNTNTGVRYISPHMYTICSTSFHPMTPQSPLRECIWINNIFYMMTLLRPGLILPDQPGL